MAIKPYLQLVRLPNLFTAAADSLAGWLIVRGSLDEPGRWLPPVLASVAIYAAGTVLNDVFDHDIDLVERPMRPLPSGKVSRRLAAWGGGVALALGPALAALSGSMMSSIVASCLAGCVLGYDAGLKRTGIGPVVMGLCRGLNLLLGMSQDAHLGGSTGWLVAGSLALFVVGITWISRSEVETGRTRGIAAGIILQNLAFLGLIFGSISLSRNPPSGASRGLLLGSMLPVLFAAIALVNLADNRAFRRAEPRFIQRAVKTGVLSLVWLDVALVAASQGPALALVVASLWVPAFVLGRWLYST